MKTEAEIREKLNNLETELADLNRLLQAKIASDSWLSLNGSNWLEFVVTQRDRFQADIELLRWVLGEERKA